MARLVGALEVLYAQEALQAKEGDHAGARATQERAEPLIQRLSELGSASVTGPTRIRLAALAELRRKSQQRIGAEMARLRQELIRTRAIQTRLKRLAPAYGRGVERRLSLVA